MHRWGRHMGPRARPSRGVAEVAFISSSFQPTFGAVLTMVALNIEGPNANFTIPLSHLFLPSTASTATVTGCGQTCGAVEQLYGVIDRAQAGQAGGRPTGLWADTPGAWAGKPATGRAKRKHRHRLVHYCRTHRRRLVHYCVKHRRRLLHYCRMRRRRLVHYCRKRRRRLVHYCRKRRRRQVHYCRKRRRLLFTIV